MLLFSFCSMVLFEVELQFLKYLGTFRATSGASRWSTRRPRSCFSTAKILRWIWIVPLNDNLTFAPFHISFKGGWLDTHHFAEEGGELAQVDLLWISSLFIFWNLVFVTVVHLPGCRRSEGDGVGGEACTDRGGGEWWRSHWHGGEPSDQNLGDYWFGMIGKQIL